MFAVDLKDPGRFFALWDFLSKEENNNNTNPTCSRSLLLLALNTAIDSQSVHRTLSILREMYNHAVFPTPQLAARLAAVARDITEVHELMHLFVRLQQHRVYAQKQKDQMMLQTRIDEHELQVYRHHGKPNIRSNETEEQKARNKYFKIKDKYLKEKWLPLKDFIANKQKGGEAYALRHDRPTPNLIEP